MVFFDFHLDHFVLIGREIWYKFGGDCCYEEILSIAYEIGRETKEIIKNIR